MSEDNNNSNNDLSLEEIKEELDKLKKRNRQESFLMSVKDDDSYRTSQQDDYNQNQEDDDDLDRTDAFYSKKTNQETHSLWARLRSFLWNIEEIILSPFAFLFFFLISPGRACEALQSILFEESGTCCYRVNRPHDRQSRPGCGCFLLFWGVIGSLLIIFLLWRTFVPSPSKTTDSLAPSNSKLAMPVDKENAIVNPKTELPVEEHKQVPETIRKEE